MYMYNQAAVMTIGLLRQARQFPTSAVHLVRPIKALVGAVTEVVRPETLAPVTALAAEGRAVYSRKVMPE